MSFDNQINLVKKINESGELKFFNTQSAFKSMQSNASYDNEAMALNDLIDNSLDANASEVNILLVTGANRTPDDYSLRDSGRSRPDRISAILVQDNGTGMADGFTRAACAYGWSSKKDKKNIRDIWFWSEKCRYRFWF